ncbi:hypothetical protein V0288_02040 [Pannus brasiliensis CCIBt3594]|uniref:Transcriptional regulator n=1 Tax=Pannus brasiliensis CCIBt3594 TaxID=1427578 RepID=A0AAW9QQL2_9CHRO
MPTKNYREDLLARLADADYASRYLKAAWDETLRDGNREAFLLALQNLVDATNLDREKTGKADVSEAPFDALSTDKGYPTLETLVSVLNSVGLTIDFPPVSRHR